MLTWLLVNVLLGLLALGFVNLNATAPHRMRFLAAITALAAWFVPWPVLPELLPVNLLSMELWRIERVVEAGSTRLSGVLPIVVQAEALPLARGIVVLSVLEMVLLALLLVGSILFARRLAVHHALLQRLRLGGKDGDWLWSQAGLPRECPVLIQHEISGAFSSGLLRPRIWVHADLVHCRQLGTVLGHELTHIRQHDNWYLLAITLAEQLFWWNPLVRLLGHRARELLELSCDERCQKRFADYPARLAELMLDAAHGGQQPRILALGANIFDTPNPNIKRLKLLQRSYPMLPRHLVSAAVTAIIAVASIGLVTAQPEPQITTTDDGFVIRRQIQEVEVDGGKKIILLQQGGADAGVGVSGELPVAGGETRVFRRFGVLGSSGMSNQLVQVHDSGTEQLVSFSYTDAPLQMALAPLANMLAGSLIPPQGAGAPGAAPGMVAADNLRFEYDGVEERTVTASATALPLEEAIALIAEESGCNIFRDGTDLVLDWCED